MKSTNGKENQKRKKDNVHHLISSIETMKEGGFFTPMVGDFSQRMTVPEASVEWFRRNILQKTETIKLNSPSGKIWEISLIASTDKIFFSFGWPEFIRAHSIKELDVLAFDYEGNSFFSVLVFDSTTRCQRKLENNAETFNARKLARSLTQPSFTRVMTKYNVCRESGQFKLIIPSEFAITHLGFRKNQKIQKIALCVPNKDEEWIVNCGSLFHISGGWRFFVDDNNLHVGDECVFELSEANDGGLGLIVHILCA